MEDFFSNRLKFYILESIDRNNRWTVISTVCSIINMLLSIAILIKLAITH